MQKQSQPTTFRHNGRDDSNVEIEAYQSRTNAFKRRSVESIAVAVRGENEY